MRYGYGRRGEGRAMGMYRGYAARVSEEVPSSVLRDKKIAKQNAHRGAHRGAHSNGCSAIACDAVRVERAAAAPPPPWS